MKLSQHPGKGQEPGAPLRVSGQGKHSLYSQGQDSLQWQQAAGSTSKGDPANKSPHPYGVRCSPSLQYRERGKERGKEDHSTSARKHVCPHWSKNSPSTPHQRHWETPTRKTPPSHQMESAGTRGTPPAPGKRNQPKQHHEDSENGTVLLEAQPTKN